MRNQDIPIYFQLFTEIGILEQLSRATAEARFPKGILMTHFSVLNHLARVGDGQTPLTLARAFQTPKTSMTHTLAGLEKRGWVETRPNPKDGRSKCVWITPEGQGFLGEAIQGMAPAMMALAEAFPPDKIADLGPRLAEIRAFMDTARDQEG